jgi:hypothetical protein
MVLRMACEAQVECMAILRCTWGRRQWTYSASAGFSEPVVCSTSGTWSSASRWNFGASLEFVKWIFSWRFQGKLLSFWTSIFLCIIFRRPNQCEANMVSRVVSCVKRCLFCWVSIFLHIPWACKIGNRDCGMSTRPSKVTPNLKSVMLKIWIHHSYLRWRFEDEQEIENSSSKSWSLADIKVTFTLGNFQAISKILSLMSKPETPHSHTILVKQDAECHR